MTDSLRDLLRRDGDDVEIPTLDASYVIGQGERHLRRRRVAAALAAAAVVAGVVAGGVVVGGSRQGSEGPVGRSTDGHDATPNTPDDTHTTDSTEVAPPVTRKVVYVDQAAFDNPDGPKNTTVHYGSRVLDIGAPDDWYFMDVTDNGFVYIPNPPDETDVMFTDGGTPVRIGSSVCPDLTGFQGVQVRAANEGSLVAWFDCSSPGPADLVVFDTGAGREVAREPIADCGIGVRGCAPDAIIGEHVYVGAQMFDLSTGQVSNVNLVNVAFHDGPVAQAYLDDLRSHPRGLVIGDSWNTGTPTPKGVGFTVIGERLVPTSSRGDNPPLTSAFDTATHQELDLHVPAGYDGADGFTLFEWLDDNTVAMIGPTGWDDAPGYGDIITCRLSDGSCELTAPGKGPVRVEANGSMPG